MSRLASTTAIALVLLPLAMGSYANAGTTKPTSSNPTAGLPTYGTTAPLLTSVVKISQIQNLPAGKDPQYVILKSPTGTPQIYTLGCGAYGRAAGAGCGPATKTTTSTTASKPATSSGPLGAIVASSNAREATVQAQNERTTRVAGYDNTPKTSTSELSWNPVNPGKTGKNPRNGIAEQSGPIESFATSVGGLNQAEQAVGGGDNAAVQAANRLVEQTPEFDQETQTTLLHDGFEMGIGIPQPAAESGIPGISVPLTSVSGPLSNFGGNAGTIWNP
jgi:hypothetical protein